MQLPNDPVMLMSVINLKLRDFYSNLELAKFNLTEINFLT